MKTPTRRDLVLGIGAAAGVATLNPSGSFGAIAADPDPGEILRRIRLSGEAERNFLARMGSGATSVALPPGHAREVKDVAAVATVKAGRDGQVFAHGLTFTCNPRFLNRFTIAGRPLDARRFCFSTSAINWSAGFGLPVYETYCPRYDYGSGATYPGAKWHQIVPVIGGQVYFTGCQAGDVCEASTPGPVCFDVNDCHHDDNIGSYEVTIWSWS